MSQNLKATRKIMYNKNNLLFLKITTTTNKQTFKYTSEASGVVFVGKLYFCIGRRQTRSDVGERRVVNWNNRQTIVGGLQSITCVIASGSDFSQVEVNIFPQKRLPKLQKCK